MKSPKVAYNGKIFDTELCARWAVYFDALEIEYKYKPQELELSNELKYLPDFYLPELDAWVEVKGAPMLDGVEFEKVRLLCIDTQKPVIVLKGDPSFKSYDIVIYDGEVDCGVNAININMVLDKESDTGLLESYHLFGEEEFEAYGEEGVRAKRAVIQSKDTLFETINKTEEQS